MRAQDAHESRSRRTAAVSLLFTLATLAAIGCHHGEDAKAPTQPSTTSTSTSTATPSTSGSLLDRAYILSLKSDEMTVIDLGSLEVIGRVPTGAIQAHQAEPIASGKKVYVSSPGTDEVIVVDAVKLVVQKKIPLPSPTVPTHMSWTPDARFLVVMGEEAGSVTFIDSTTDTVATTLTGFYTPHFMRFSKDEKTGFVANLGACHLTVVDVASRTVVGHLPLQGFQGPPQATLAPNETGFADCQVDPSGVLYAAHRATGRVLVFDTVSGTKLPELQVGQNPWIVYAGHPFASLPALCMVPCWGDLTTAILDGTTKTVSGSVTGDAQCFGVNYTPLAPGKAFVMNRMAQEATVIDMVHGKVIDHIALGGATETASTTPDGKLIVAPISSNDTVVIIDALANRVVKTFYAVGSEPWSGSVPNGQNYCH